MLGRFSTPFSTFPSLLESTKNVSFPATNGATTSKLKSPAGAVHFIIWLHHHVTHHADDVITPASIHARRRTVSQLTVFVTRITIVACCFAIFAYVVESCTRFGVSAAVGAGAYAVRPVGDMRVGAVSPVATLTFLCLLAPWPLYRCRLAMASLMSALVTAGARSILEINLPILVFGHHIRFYDVVLIRHVPSMTDTEDCHSCPTNLARVFETLSPHARCFRHASFSKPVVTCRCEHVIKYLRTTSLA